MDNEWEVDPYDEDENIAGVGDDWELSACDEYHLDALGDDVCTPNCSPSSHPSHTDNEVDFPNTETDGHEHDHETNHVFYPIDCVLPQEKAIEEDCFACLDDIITAVTFDFSEEAHHLLDSAESESDCGVDCVSSDEESEFLEHVQVSRDVDPVVRQLQRLLEKNHLKRSDFFYKYLKNVLSFAENITRAQFQWDDEIKEFGQSLYYHGHEKVLNLIRGQGFVNTGRGGIKTFDWSTWNLPFPSVRTLKCTRMYQIRNGIHKALQKAYLDICQDTIVSAILENEKMKVIPVVYKADGISIKPGMQVDSNIGEIVGTTVKIDFQYIKENPNPRANDLKDTFVTEAHVVAVTSLDGSLSLPLGVHYTPSKGSGHEMLDNVIEDTKCIQTCLAHVEKEIVDDRSSGIMEKDTCQSRCIDCEVHQTVCHDCAEKGQKHWVPSLRACDYCLSKNIKCVKMVVVVFSMDSESKNSSAQDEFEQLVDRGIELYFLKGCPDAVHTSKRITRHTSNWFLPVDDALINRVQLRSLRNDHDVKDDLKKHLTIAACRNRDRMDVDTMLEISSKAVRDTITSKAEFITQTIIPEVYRVYDGNKKGAIGAPTAVCNGDHGSLLVIDIRGGAYTARLHYPVDVSQVTSGLALPLGVAYHNGVMYITESGKGEIHVIDLQGKSLYNPDKLAVKDLREILKRHGVQVLSGANKGSLKKSMVEWLEKEGGSGFREKQKCIQNISLSKPAALHIDDDGKMYVGDLASKEVHVFEVSTNGIYASAADIRTQKFNDGDVLSITSNEQYVYFAVAGELGGIYFAQKEALYAGGSDVLPWTKIISNNSPSCGAVHGLEVYNSDDQAQELVFTDQQRATVNILNLVNGETKIISGKVGEKGSKDGTKGLYQQPTSICCFGKTIFVCDTAAKMVKLISPGDSMTKYLQNVDSFLRTFEVSLPGERKQKINLEDGEVRIRDVRTFLETCKEKVVAIKGSDNIQGPDGVNSIQTYKDIQMIEVVLGHLKSVLDVNPLYNISLSALTTLYVENFFSEMREGNDMPTMLQFAYKLYSCIRERIKASTQTSLSYFTSAKSYFSKITSSIKVSLAATKSIKLNIPKDHISELRDWRCEHGQSVRQLTVRNMSTKDKPGTLPMNCYSFQPEPPEPIDFTRLDTNVLHNEPTVLPRKEDVILFKKGSFATIKSVSGISVVRFTEHVLLTDESAHVEIYEQMLTVLEYVLSRNVVIRASQIIKDVAVQLLEDTLMIHEDDYYLAIAATAEDKYVGTERNQ